MNLLQNQSQKKLIRSRNVGCKCRNAYTIEMRPQSDSKWSRIMLVIFFILILGYGYFELQGLLFGPIISVPTEIIISHEEFALVAGKADRIVSLAMNGKEITVTEDGDFSEPYLLARGDNRIIFDAKDKYGNLTSRMVEIVYTPTTSAEVHPPSDSVNTTTPK